MSCDGLTVFFPAYNEEENVRFMIETAREALDELHIEEWEIIVVDDGSNDRTAEITAEMSESDNRIRLSRHNRNMGFGNAIRTGIMEARMPWIFYTDCDGQFDMRDLDGVWELRNEADIVSAYRRRRNDPWMRLAYSVAYNTLIFIMFAGGFKDVDSSFKLFRRNIFRTVRPQSETGVIDFEILTLARRHGFRILQIPVQHFPRRAGNVSFETARSGCFAWVRTSAIIDMFRELIELRIKLWRGEP